MARLFAIGMAMAGLAACGASTSAKVDIGETRFRINVVAESEDRRDFSATVTPAAADIDGALEAAGYGATRYCLLNFGGSDNEWTAGPGAPKDNLAIDGGRLTLAGRCTQR